MGKLTGWWSEAQVTIKVRVWSESAFLRILMARTMCHGRNCSKSLCSCISPGTNMWGDSTDAEEQRGEPHLQLSLLTINKLNYSAFSLNCIGHPRLYLSFSIGHCQGCVRNDCPIGIKMADDIMDAHWFLSARQTTAKRREKCLIDECLFVSILNVVPTLVNIHTLTRLHGFETV